MGPKKPGDHAWFFPMLISVIIIMAFVVPGFIVGTVLYRDYLDELEIGKWDDRLDEKVHQISSGMETSLSRSLSLSAIIEYELPIDIIEENFNYIGIFFSDGVSGLVGIATFPEGELTMISPSFMTGLFLETNYFESTDPDIIELMDELESTGDVVLRGPISYADHNLLVLWDGIEKNDQLSGLTAVIIDLDMFFQPIFNHDDPGMSVRINNQDGALIWSDGLDGGSDTIKRMIEVGNEEWVLTGSFNIIWNDEIKLQLVLAITTYILLSVILVGSVFFFLYTNRKLKQMVDSKTESLEERSKVLSTEVERRKRSETMVRMEKYRSDLYLDLLSHDVGNLHQGTLLNLELYDRDVVKGEMKEKMIHSAIDTLKRSIALVNNVKMLSYIKNLETPLDEIILEDKLRSSVSEVSKTFMEREPEIGLRFKGKNRILADSLLDQVFINIISNGIKAQDGKGPRIDVDVSLKSSFVVVRISDHGPGIPDEMKKRMLDRDNMRKKRERTSGIGLSIVTSLMERYGGQVEVRDRVRGYPDRGSMFILNFRKAPQPRGGT